eukprot:3899201-Prymnesium_polylepis.1
MKRSVHHTVVIHTFELGYVSFSLRRLQTLYTRLAQCGDPTQCDMRVGCGQLPWPREGCLNPARPPGRCQVVLESVPSPVHAL